MRADLVLAGFGNVGRRLARLLGEREPQLRRDYDLEPRIVGIATRQHGAVFAAKGVEVAAMLERRHSGRPLGACDRDRDPAATVHDLIARLASSDAPLRVLIETTPLSIAAGQPAIEHIEAALGAGCDAITANKGPVAFAYRRLRDRAVRADRSFLFEGAVMDGVPIFNLVRETMPALVLRGFRGVVNSTTNHIISALEEGEEFGPALARMQAEGIAEADPSLDVDGWDAAAKTAALANVLLGADLTLHDVNRTGIDAHSGERARRACASGRRLRLIARAAKAADGSVSGIVRPEELEADDVLAQLRGTANALVLHTDLLGDIAIHQLGGDVTMTAYALLSDLITIRRRAGA